MGAPKFLFDFAGARPITRIVRTEGSLFADVVVVTTTPLANPIRDQFAKPCFASPG